MLLQLLSKNMEKLQMLTIKRIKENVRYYSIISLLRLIQERKFDTGLELKDFTYFFIKRHEMIMKDALGDDKCRLPKDVINDISNELRNLFGSFTKATDIHTYLKRLYPYVKPYPNSKPSKYHVTDFFYTEWLKDAVLDILKDCEKGKILNFDREKDKAVKIIFSKKKQDQLVIHVPIDILK